MINRSIATSVSNLQITLLAEPIALQLSASAGLSVQGNNKAEMFNFSYNSKCHKDFTVNQ